MFRLPLVALPLSIFPLFVLLLDVLGLALLPGDAGATQQGVQMMKNWKSMDQCTRDAQAAFPDFTPEANAKRDAKLKECLAARNMPPRDPLSPKQ